MTNIVVLVSGGGTNLQALLEVEAKSGLGGGKIVGVISSNPNAYALERAKKFGVPTYVIGKNDYPSRQELTLALLAKCRELNAQLIIMAGFLLVLTPEFMDAYPNAIINVHPSLIPSFCGDTYYGLHVHEAALAYGVKLTGATVHFVTHETDSGPIILQRSVPIQEGDTPEVLQKRVMEEAEWQLLPQAVTLFCQGRLRVEGRHVHITEREE